MKTKKLANKIAIVVCCILAVIGAAISVLLLVNSVKYGFDWYRFIPAMLYVICFADLVAYACTGAIKSRPAFQSVLFSYALVVIVTGILFPPIYPQGTKVFFLICSALIVLGLIGFNFFWSNVKASRIFLTFAFVAECVAAYGALTGNPMAMEDNVVAQLAVFIRPIILTTLAVCYLTRMYEKSLEGKNDENK